ncbi:MAG: hypothetical protein HYV27_00900 [Candidatus Hydrogenedentes bacterium]|nr:hypothetical protein [Candidatus Hydrogenedentota bacterium]
MTDQKPTNPNPKRRLSRRRYWLTALIVVAAIAGIGLYVFGDTVATIDGCECGRRRGWLQVMRAPLGFRHIKLRMTILAPGDPNHKHDYWDGQSWDYGNISLLWRIKWPDGPIL